MSDEIGDLLRYFLCRYCVDEHGTNPQSVSCYCDCHHSDKDERRWKRVARLDILKALGPENEHEARRRIEHEEAFR